MLQKKAFKTYWDVVCNTHVKSTQNFGCWMNKCHMKNSGLFWNNIPRYVQQQYSRSFSQPEEPANHLFYVGTPNTNSCMRNLQMSVKYFFLQQYYKATSDGSIQFGLGAINCAWVLPGSNKTLEAWAMNSFLIFFSHSDQFSSPTQHLVCCH